MIVIVVHRFERIFVLPLLLPAPSKTVCTPLRHTRLTAMKCGNDLVTIKHAHTHDSIPIRSRRIERCVDDGDNGPCTIEADEDGVALRAYYGFSNADLAIAIDVNAFHEQITRRFNTHTQSAMLSQRIHLCRSTLYMQKLSLDRIRHRQLDLCKIEHKTSVFVVSLEREREKKRRLLDAKIQLDVCIRRNLQNRKFHSRKTHALYDFLFRRQFKQFPWNFGSRAVFCLLLRNLFVVFSVLD